jgi:hypothetical protein
VIDDDDDLTRRVRLSPKRANGLAESRPSSLVERPDHDREVVTHAAATAPSLEEESARLATNRRLGLRLRKTACGTIYRLPVRRPECFSAGKALFDPRLPQIDTPPEHSLYPKAWEEGSPAGAQLVAYGRL